MELGLRRSWRAGVGEALGDPYELQDQRFFAHESLHVYQRSLELFRELEASVLSEASGRSRYRRRTDAVATSLVLNIAEGNGRFSHLDHRKFVGIAEEASVTLAAYLDLQEAPGTETMKTAKHLLREVSAMLTGLKGYLEK